MADVSLPLMARRFRHHVIAANLIYATALLVVGVSPDVPDIANAISDHAAHGLSTAVQAALLYILLLPSTGKGMAAVLAAGVATLYSGFIETLQFLQPSRTVEIADLAANAVGACVAASLACLVTAGQELGADR